MRRSNLQSTPVSLLLLTVVVGFLATVGQPGEAVAGEGDKKLKSVLGEIQWGDGKDTVLEKLRQRMLGKLRNRKDLRHNRVKMQRERKQVLDRFERIKESYTELRGDSTGYDVSVIAGEFTKNNNEALIRIKDKVAQRFFFFVDGEFYKMIVAYKQSYLENIGFEAFISQVARKYGRPEATDYKEIAGEEQLAFARWKDDDTILRVKNAKEFFGTYVMAFSHRSKVKQLKADNSDFGGSDKDDEEVSARVKNLSVDSESDENKDVVDSMLGESINVEMDSQQEAARKAEQKDEAKKQGDKTKGDEKVAAKESEEDDNSESQQDSGSSGGGGTDRDFSDISADGEDDGDDDQLIIY